MADSNGAMATSALAPIEAFGEVYDRGYQHYTGTRLGRRHAFRALTTYSMKRALGAKKPWTAKVIPALLYIAASLLVIIPLGIRAFFKEASVFQYWDYFEAAFYILGVFVATIAPEMLCGDRRENVLTLYFSRAITRLDYLLAKLIATALLILTVSLLPLVIYWLGRQLLEDSPLVAMKDHIGDLGRVVLASLVVSAYLGAIGLLVSSFTGRKAIAAAVITIGFLMAFAFAEIGQEVVKDEELKRYFGLLSPQRGPTEFINGLFDHEIPGDSYGEPFPPWAYGATMLGVVVFCCAVMYWRYVPRD
jgi:ABC-2 type transport system permease protein